MTVSEIIAELSPAARELLERSSDRIGAVINTEQLSLTDYEALHDMGVLGKLSGLTIKGSAVVCKIKPDLDF